MAHRVPKWLAAVWAAWAVEGLAVARAQQRPDLNGTWVRPPTAAVKEATALEIAQEANRLTLQVLRGDVTPAAKTEQKPDRELRGRITGTNVEIDLFTDDYRRALEKKGLRVPRLEGAVSPDGERLTLVLRQEPFKAPNPNPGLYAGITIPGQATELGTFYRLSCGRPAVKADPLLTGAGRELRHLNWRMNLSVSANDGLVLRDVTLGNRLMAERISVPYVMVRVNSGYERRCELRPDGNDTECRSRLIDLPAVRFEADRLIAEASFAVDRIPGRDSPDPTSKNCLVITQRYEFEREIDPRLKPDERYEPLGEMPHAKFRPLVRYRYYTDSLGPTSSFRVAVPQRFHFRIDGAPANAATVLRDCEVPSPVLKDPLDVFVVARPAARLLERLIALVGRDCVQIAQGTEESPQELAIMKVLGGNPLPSEVSVTGIKPDKAKTLMEGLSSISSDWDNYHQTSSARVSLPVYTAGIRRPGCPECVHMHWRWPEFASLPPPLGGGHRFGDGHPLVPAGSDQFATVAVVSNRAGEEDPPDVEKLVDPSAALGPDPVFWLTTHGARAGDTFFTHGGAFASLNSYGRLAFGVSALPGARVGVPYDVALDIRGGLEPYSVGGAVSRLPAGLRLEGTHIVGTPTTAQKATFLVRVIDHAGAYIDHDFTIQVTP